MTSKKRILPLIALSFLSLSLAALSPKAAKAEGEVNALGLTVRQVKSPASFHTVLQRKYIEHGTKNVERFASANAEISRPDAIRFKWDVSNVSSGDNVRYTFTISESPDMSGGRSYSVGSAQYADVYNLKLATRYYYQVKGTLNGEVSESEILHFTTEQSVIRNLYLDGVTNARDLGGWRNGQALFMVKQGMIYRSGPFNASNVSSLQTTITSSGLAEVRKLGIKTEIDLRRTDNGETGGITTRSPLGSGVKYVSAPLNWDNADQALTRTDNIASVKKVFEVLGDPNNYPVNFHCTAGADRTGMIAFLINGLLGVSEADLYRDYMFTNFANVYWIRKRSTIENSWVRTIKSQEGVTLQDKIVHLLRSFGVSLDDLSTLYFLMQEEGYRA